MASGNCNFPCPARQVLRISYVTEDYEGVYRCEASNRVGRSSARQLVRLRSTVEADQRFSTLSYPILAAVAVSIFLVLLLVRRGKQKKSFQELKSVIAATGPSTSTYFILQLKSFLLCFCM